jgi:hypothetical protein
MAEQDKETPAVSLEELIASTLGVADAEDLKAYRTT